MAQMKEQHKTPEKELSNAEIADLSDAEFKTLWSESSKMSSNRSKTKAMKSLLRETKTNPQETNREGKGAGIQINDLEHKKEISIQLEQQE